MSHSSQVRVLVSGDVEGKFDDLFKRVNSIIKKQGEFDMLLCIGSFFGENNDEWPNYANNIKTAPISTYVLGPCKEEHEKYFLDERGKELCPNIFYFGKRGVMTGCSGLRIVYLSGIERSNRKGLESITSKDIEHLIPNPTDIKSADILLTSEWPANITKYSSTPTKDSQKFESALVAKLVYFLKPRYHFAGLADCFYERPPYRNHKVCSETAVQTTRFISLAKVKSKDKWLYAFTIQPMSSINKAELIKQPLDVTECPFQLSEADHPSFTSQEKNQIQQYFYDTNSNISEQNNKRKYQNSSHGHKRQKLLSNCWFCLKSPDVEKHLILSIGNHNYLSLCKGGLTEDHILILPIDHISSTMEVSKECYNEIHEYKKALAKYFYSQKKIPVFFERNFKSPHLQIQVVPIPLNISSEVKNALIDHAEAKDLKFESLPTRADLRQMIPNNMPYFLIEWDDHKFVHLIKDQFPLQFGREILASRKILNIPEKEDYKNCLADKELEIKLAHKFKQHFKPFDFTD